MSIPAAKFYLNFANILHKSSVKNVLRKVSALFSENSFGFEQCLQVKGKGIPVLAQRLHEPE